MQSLEGKSNNSVLAENHFPKGKKQIKGKMSLEVLLEEKIATIFEHEYYFVTLDCCGGKSLFEYEYGFERAHDL